MKRPKIILYDNEFLIYRNIQTFIYIDTHPTIICKISELAGFCDIDSMIYRDLTGYTPAILEYRILDNIDYYI